GDPDIDVLDVRIQPARPWVVLRNVLDLTRPLCRRASPTIAAKLAERAGRGTVHDCLYIVVRAIRSTFRIAAVRLVATVVRRIPPAMGKIEPPDERDCIVDHHHFLVVRSADRMPIVEPEPQAPMRAPVQL